MRAGSLIKPGQRCTHGLPPACKLRGSSGLAAQAGVQISSREVKACTSHGQRLHVSSQPLSFISAAAAALETLSEFPRRESSTDSVYLQGDHQASVHQLKESLHQQPQVHLSTRIVKAHTGAITACVIREHADCTEVITASLDKSIATWRLTQDDDSCLQNIELCRVPVEGGPVFSLANSIPSIEQRATNVTPALFCGLASKSIVTYNPGDAAVGTKVMLNGHTGWVRALASDGKWLLSCGCNYLRLWDASLAVPKLSHEVKLFTGDILGIACGGKRVFTAGADGSIRSWRMEKGELEECAVQEKAHDGRVSSLLLHNGLLYTAGFDGAIKAWSADSLEHAMSVSGVNAHNGLKVHCLAIGPDQVLYSGGDDQLIRRWHPSTLEQLSDPLSSHTASVRVISSGLTETLASGDSDGSLCIWNIPRAGPSCSGAISTFKL